MKTALTMSNQIEEAEDDNEPVRQHQPCPGGIPMSLLRNMSQEDIDEWVYGEFPKATLAPGPESTGPTSKA